MSEKTAKYEKPSGVVIEVNDNAETQEYAALNGWKPVKAAPKKAKKGEGAE